MKAKIVFVLNKRKLSGILTRIGTGCYCYHVGILIGNNFYDMNWMRRWRSWGPHEYPHDYYVIFDSPVEISEDMLLDKIVYKNTHYGVYDYLFYIIKPVFRFLKLPTKNFKGTICSEQVHEDLIDSGWKSPWNHEKHPPSPCEMLEYFSNKYERLK